MNKSRKSVFDPKTAFFSLPIIKWTLGIGIVSIIGLSLWIILFSSREFDPRAEGFNEFLEMMKVPIFLLGFFAALLALFATNHRSEQNKAAMNLAEAQNRFSNYYKHIEEYDSYLQNQFKRYSEDAKPVINIQKLHRSIYPNAKSDGIQFLRNVESTIFENTYQFVQCLAKTNFKEKDEIIKLIIKTDDSLENIISALTHSIKFRTEDGSINFPSEKGIIKIPAARLRNFLTEKLNKIEFINAILHFEETFNSDLLELVIRHTRDIIKHIPNISIGGDGNIGWHDNPEITSSEEFAVLEEKINGFQAIVDKLRQEIRGS